MCGEEVNTCCLDYWYHVVTKTPVEGCYCCEAMNCKNYHLYNKMKKTMKKTMKRRSRYKPFYTIGDRNDFLL